jgi:hypothetical protein
MGEISTTRHSVCYALTATVRISRLAWVNLNAHAQVPMNGRRRPEYHQPITRSEGLNCRYPQATSNSLS